MRGWHLSECSENSSLLLANEERVEMARRGRFERGRRFGVFGSEPEALALRAAEMVQAAIARGGEEKHDELSLRHVTLARGPEVRPGVLRNLLRGPDISGLLRAKAYESVHVAAREGAESVPGPRLREDHQVVSRSDRRGGTPFGSSWTRRGWNI